MASTHRYRDTRTAGVWQRLPHGAAPAVRRRDQAALQWRRRTLPLAVPPLLLTGLLWAAQGVRGV
jgi:hypothetical protein